MDWGRFFNDLAVQKTTEHERVGWGSVSSQMCKFHTADKKIPFSDLGSVLDIGCGGGVLESFLYERYPHLNLYGVDIADQQLKRAKDKGVTRCFARASMLRLPYKSLSFDCVCCIGVIQNFTGDLSKALDEMIRVVGEGGYLYLVSMDKSHPGYVEDRRGPDRYQRYQIPEDVAGEIESRGLQIMSVGSISNETEEGVIVPLHSVNTYFVVAGRR